MNPATTIMGTYAKRRPRSDAASALRRGDALMFALFASMLLAVWQISQMRLFSAGSDTGYWIGVAGGVMMLLLFAYPLRKRWQALAGIGKAKHWFVVHMVLGIGGPILVLAHSTFRIGSINAGVALWSMVIVAVSGVMGRFIYLRIHRGLGGERLSFEALRDTLGLTATSVQSQLHFAPRAEARLRALEKHAGLPGDGWAEQLRRLTVLPWALHLERRRCRRETDEALQFLARERGWDAAKLHARAARARRLADDYITAILRVAQLAAYTRLFSLWHVLHVPFVFVMVLCAIAHVVAVHAY
jgi:hypothetical protein